MPSSWVAPWRFQVSSLRPSADSRPNPPNYHDWHRKLTCFQALGERLKYPIDGCPADAKGGRYSAGRLAAIPRHWLSIPAYLPGPFNRILVGAHFGASACRVCL